MRTGLLSLVVVVAGVLGAPAALSRDGDSLAMTVDDRVFTGNPLGVSMRGSVAWIGLDSGVASLDVSVPGAPILMGHAYLPSEANDIAVDAARSLAYVAAGESGLIVLDIADPSDPMVLGAVLTPFARGVAFDGTLVAVACAGATASERGVQLVDVLDAMAPALLGFEPLANGALDVALAGSLALVGIGADPAAPKGLVTVDVAAPGSPAALGFHDTGVPVNGVVWNGSHAWLATGLPLAGALVAVDVSAPAAPVRVSRSAIGDAARGLSVIGQDAFVASSSLSVVRFDIANPALPRRVDQLPPGREAVAVGVNGATLVVAERSSTGGGAFVTADASIIPGMSRLAALPFAEATGAAEFAGLFLALRRDALHVVDPGTVPAGILSSWTPAGADFSSITTTGTLALVAQGECVRIVDLADPGAPTEAGQACVATGAALGVSADGGVLCVATGRTLDIFDVSDPATPALLQQFDPGFAVSLVAVSGARAAVAGSDVIAIVDLASPSSPSLLGSVAIGDPVQGLAFDGTIVAAAGLVLALHVVDATTPSAPAEVATLGAGPAFGVALRSSRAFVAQGRAGLFVAGLAVPSAPTLDAAHDTSSTATAVATSATAAFVATRDAQFWVLGCTACASGCSIAARALGAGTACQFAPLTLDAGTSSAAGCAGALAYQWFEAGVPIAGATDPTLVADTSTVGRRFYSVEVTCPSQPGCRDAAAATVDVIGETFAMVDAASLRVNRNGADDIISWTVSGPGGPVNIHRALDPSLVTASAIDASTVWVTTSLLAEPVPDAPGLGNCFYLVVHGRGECSGQSVVVP